MAAQERIEVRSMLPFREDLQVGQYYMFDAAIPSEAIDETLRSESREDDAFAKYVPSAWHDYTNASLDDQWLALAKYVPAVSSPVGGREMGAVENNVDMNNDSADGGVPRPNRWGRPAVKNQTPWMHSDMKDMAFFYVYKLYEQLIQKGHLK